MNILYFMFAVIPIATLAAALFPELTGRGEAILVGGFEYSIYLPKLWLLLGGFGTSVFGILFLFAIEDPASLLFHILPIFSFLVLTLLGEVLSLLCIVLYFGYRLTVRSGTIFYKLPFKKESIIPLSQIEGYSVFERRKGRISIRIYAEKRVILVQGQGTENLLCELRSRNIKEYGHKNK